MEDDVDRILAQWARERPDLDVAPMGVIGRLSRTSLAVSARLAATFARHGLDEGSFGVLAALLRAGDPWQLSPRELTATTMVTTAATAQRLNKLEARGLVARTRNEHDKRGTLVRLTPPGKALVEAALPDHLDNERSLLAGLGASDQARLIDLLRRVSANADLS